MITHCPACRREFYVRLQDGPYRTEQRDKILCFECWKKYERRSPHDTQKEK